MAYRVSARIVFGLLLAAGAAAGQLNHPYPAGERDAKIYYGSFTERPKHLDPAVAYSSDEYRFICQIYEPVVQYHYLKRPYVLVPLTAEKMPECVYYDKEGNRLPPDAPAEKVARAVWTIRIKKGIMYQEHPCFARDGKGNFLYHHLSAADVKGIHTLFDFPRTGTRELKARDYVYQIKRLADPRNRCPIFAPVVAEYILGMKEYARLLSRKIEAIRRRRREEQGIFYNREEDEKKNPIIIDYHALPCKGVEVVDDYTYRIVLNKKYPQFVYWLAMPFFAPMPEEAVLFYSQAQTIEKNIILDWYPVGTGPYRLAMFDPSWRIVLVKNENYHDDFYPAEGEPDDAARGLLAAAGKRLPLIPKAVYSVEKEATPRWRKFLQGYYDISGISSENFSKVMDLHAGEARLSGKMRERGIRLVTSVDTTIIYLGFNMDDPVVGGLDEKKCKLRRALSIAIDRKEYIQIFRNGRGIVAHGPIPPGIFGYEEGRKGMNPYVFDWDEKLGRPVRKSLEEAKRLLAEAGYPGGVDENGKQLTVRYDTVQFPGNVVYLEWLKKQFAKINVALEVSETDYNRFREKMNTGNYQIFGWGWNADYPDPENFLFLLYGPNSKVKYHGENAANYANPEYDRLFEKMKTMENSPARLEIIRKMVEILRRDAPWEFGFFPKSYALYHAWVSNVKPNKMANNTLKYMDIDEKKRRAYQREHNKPKLGVVAGALAFFILLFLPGVILAFRREMG